MQKKKKKEITGLLDSVIIIKFAVQSYLAIFKISAMKPGRSSGVCALTLQEQDGAANAESKLIQYRLEKLVTVDRNALVAVNHDTGVSIINRAGIDQIILNSHKTGSLLSLDDLGADDDPSSMANMSYAKRATRECEKTTSHSLKRTKIYSESLRNEEEARNLTNR
jgi:hypothetical protein